jgi:hypothetical protein
MMAHYCGEQFAVVKVVVADSCRLHVGLMLPHAAATSYSLGVL